MKNQGYMFHLTNIRKTSKLLSLNPEHRRMNIVNHSLYKTIPFQLKKDCKPKIYEDRKHETSRNKNYRN